MKPFEICLKAGNIRKLPGIKEKSKLELRVAGEDLKEAKNRYASKRYKYATRNAYYALFHAARSLLYVKGYREKSHYCLKIAIEELYVKEKLLEPEHLDYFEEAMGLREAADYQSVFSKDGARRAIKGAEAFIRAAKEILSYF